MKYKMKKESPIAMALVTVLVAGTLSGCPSGRASSIAPTKNQSTEIKSESPINDVKKEQDIQRQLAKEAQEKKEAQIEGQDSASSDDADVDDADDEGFNDNSEDEESLSVSDQQRFVENAKDLNAKVEQAEEELSTFSTRIGNVLKSSNQAAEHSPEAQQELNQLKQKLEEMQGSLKQNESQAFYENTKYRAKKKSKKIGFRNGYWSLKNGLSKLKTNCKYGGLLGRRKSSRKVQEKFDKLDEEIENIRQEIKKMINNAEENIMSKTNEQGQKRKGKDRFKHVQEITKKARPLFIKLRSLKGQIAVLEERIETRKAKALKKQEKLDARKQTLRM